MTRWPSPPVRLGFILFTSGVVAALLHAERALSPMWGQVALGVSVAFALLGMLLRWL